jgi:hypothetical protein
MAEAVTDNDTVTNYDYVLLLDATVGSSDALKGDFDGNKGKWVSNNPAFTSRLDDTALSLQIGDTVTFAVRVNSSDTTKPSNGIGYYNLQLNFVVATINSTSRDNSKIDSPFQIPGRSDHPVWPLMLGNRIGAGNLNTFFRYSAGNGALVQGNGDNTNYLGLVRATVATQGNFEIVVCAEVNGQGVYCQFSHDPEIDTGQ